MKYCNYLVKNEFIEEDKIHWKPTGNGEYIIGSKLRNDYFIKRNIHVRYPSKDLPREVYKQYYNISHNLEKKQKELRNLMKDINWKTDHILVEKENFWDSEKMFTTVTNYIAHALPSNYDFTSLTLKEFHELILEIAKLVKKITDCKVIHSDIKEKNLLICKEYDKYIPYLIDFDSSFSINNIPKSEDIGGTEGYQSPEIISYIFNPNIETKKDITPKTDVFSLGIVFHRLWTNSFPGIDMEKGNVTEAILLNKKITLSRKFNKEIGPRYHATFLSLINWMLEKNVEYRCSIDDVINVLSDKKMVNEKYHIGDDYKLYDKELWGTHSHFATIIGQNELEKKNISLLKKFNDGSGSAGLKYLVIKNDKESIIGIKEMISYGYAKKKSIVSDEAWPEHNVSFLDFDKLFVKGYYCINRINLLGNHKYIVKEINGRETDRSCEWLIKNGLAILKKIEIDVDKPWPEHAREYNLDSLQRRNVKKISRVLVASEHRYKIVFNEIIDGKNKTFENVSINNIRLMGFIK